MSKRPHSPRSDSPSIRSGTRKDASRKRARWAGSNGQSFAQRMNGTRSRKPIVIRDSSDEDSSESMNQGTGMTRSEVSSLDSFPINESGANDPSPLGQKSNERNWGAKGLADEYDPGQPDFESEAESEQQTKTRSDKETSEGGSCAMRCLAAEEKELRLELGKVTKRMEQDMIKQRKLSEDLIEIRQAMTLVGDSGP